MGVEHLEWWVEPTAEIERVIPDDKKEGTVTEDQVDRIQSDLSEDEEETWTNRPTDADSDDGSDSEIEEELPPPPAPKREIKTARDIIFEEVTVRAKRAHTRLRSQLAGTIVIEVTGKNEKFLFDWRNEEPVVTEQKGPFEIKKGEDSDSSKMDCLIQVSESNLFQVRSGDLNPQIAMLADKIKVQGKTGLAVYFFNLVSPRTGL